MLRDPECVPESYRLPERVRDIADTCLQRVERGFVDIDALNSELDAREYSSAASLATASKQQLISIEYLIELKSGAVKTCIIRVSFSPGCRPVPDLLSLPRCPLVCWVRDQVCKHWSPHRRRRRLHVADWPRRRANHCFVRVDAGTISCVALDNQITRTSGGHYRR